VPEYTYTGGNPPPSPFSSTGLRAFNCQLLVIAFPSAPPSTTVTVHAPSLLALTGQVTSVETLHAAMTKSVDQLLLYQKSLHQLYIGM